MKVQEYLTLKWGTLKGWRVDTTRPEWLKLVEIKLPVGMGRALNVEERIALCALIDVIDGPIEDDWNGGDFTKEEAKAYIMNYG